MSTAQYRQQLRQDGVDLDGMDIDHLWPHARQGANHPWNYNPLPSAINRSMGAGVAEMFEAMPLLMIRGRVVSALMRMQYANDLRAFGR
jgi:hypothetical protein